MTVVRGARENAPRRRSPVITVADLDEVPLPLSVRTVLAKRARLAAGAQLYSDERCVTVRGEVVAYPRGLNVRRDGVERLVGVCA